MRNKYGELRIIASKKVFTDGDDISDLLDEKQIEQLNEFVKANAKPFPIGDFTFLEKKLSIVICDAVNSYVLVLDKIWSDESNAFNITNSLIIGETLNIYSSYIPLNSDSTIDVANTGLQVQEISLGGE